MLLKITLRVVIILYKNSIYISMDSWFPILLMGYNPLLSLVVQIVPDLAWASSFRLISANFWQVLIIPLSTFIFLHNKMFQVYLLLSLP